MKRAAEQGHDAADASSSTSRSYTGYPVTSSARVAAARPRAPASPRTGSPPRREASVDPFAPSSHRVLVVDTPAQLPHGRSAIFKLRALHGHRVEPRAAAVAQLEHAVAVAQHRMIPSSADADVAQTRARRRRRCTPGLGFRPMPFAPSTRFRQHLRPRARARRSPPRSSRARRRSPAPETATSRRFQRTVPGRSAAYSKARRDCRGRCRF